MKTSTLLMGCGDPQSIFSRQRFWLASAQVWVFPSLALLTARCMTAWLPSRFSAVNVAPVARSFPPNTLSRLIAIVPPFCPGPSVLSSTILTQRAGVDENGIATVPGAPLVIVATVFHARDALT